jgi:outer membrane murein-binding lipoprotein Lpp
MIPFRATLVNAVVGTIILATGSTIISLKVEDAAQNERIARIEKLDTKMDTLSNDLQQVDLKLERLDGKLEGENEPRK